MESIANPKLLLFFVRHGERIDQVPELSASEEAQRKKNPKSDPSLTDNGKQLAKQAGELTHSFISKY